MKFAIKPLNQGDLPGALALALDVFMEFEAPEYDPAGVENFRRFIDLESIARRVEQGAWEGEALAGVIAARGADHVSMLFVRWEYQRQGIGRALVEELCQEAARQGCRVVTVNAAPYGVPAYRRMGFRATAPWQERDGMIFTPMARRLR